MEETKVLFLDIDGVLNCQQTFLTQNRHDAIEPTMVHELNRVIDATRCKVVISSSWRILWQFDELKEKLLQFSVRDAIIDVTPRLGRRDEEIQAWLDKHPQVTKFAVVDDDSHDLTAVSNFLVKTQFSTGLTSTESNSLIEMLS